MSTENKYKSELSKLLYCLYYLFIHF